jgi:hypothetical protein
MYVNELLSEAVLIQLLNVEDALTVKKFPASGSFIDVSDFERFAFLILVGALNSASTFQVEQTKTINGSPKVVTDAVVIVPGTGGGDQWYLIEVQTNELDSNGGYHYVTLDASGPAGGNDYGAIIFLGINPGYRPVTQGADCGEVVTLVG